MVGFLFYGIGNVSTDYMMKEGESMISNQILQNTLDGLKGISRTDFCVTDMDGKVPVSYTHLDVYKRQPEDRC